MTFGELYSKVLEKLGENTTPQFWSTSELKDYINRGFRQFARQTSFNTIKAPLVLVESGRHLVPSNLLKLLGVYFQGRPLEQRSVEYLESRNGKGHFAGLRGDTGSFSESTGDFRTATGNPEAWYFEENRICLYPIPETLAVASQVRTKQAGTLTAGSTVITLPTSIVTDQDYAWLFLDGVYQNNDAFVISSANQIVIDAALPIDVSYTVVGFSQPGTAIARSFKVRFTSTAGQAIFRIPRGYIPGTNAIDLAIDGIVQDPSSFTEINNFAVQTTTALLAGQSVEITVNYLASSLNAEARYSIDPGTMTADSEIPDLPEQFHDAGWMWAVFEALSREGRGKDIEKASLYSTMFAAMVNEWRESFGEKAGPDYPDMPFFV